MHWLAWLALIVVAYVGTGIALAFLLARRGEDAPVDLMALAWPLMLGMLAYERLEQQREQVLASAAARERALKAILAVRERELAAAEAEIARLLQS